MERENTGLRSIWAQGHSAGWSCSSQWRVRNLNKSKLDLNIILPSQLIVLLCVSPSSTSKLWGWPVNACVPVSNSFSKQRSLCYRGSELPAHRCSSGLPCQVCVAEVPQLPDEDQLRSWPSHICWSTFVCPLLSPEGLVASRWAAQQIWTKPSQRGKMEKPNWPSTGSRSSKTPTDRLLYASRQRQTRRENLRTALVRFLMLQTSLWNPTFVIQPVRNEVCCCHGDPVHAPSRSVNHLYPLCLWNECNILMHHSGNVWSDKCDHWPKGPTPEWLTSYQSSHSCL